MERSSGTSILTEKRGAPEFSEEDEQAILELASQAGVAIHNARLYEETRRRERWLDAMRDITNAVLSGTGSDEALVLVASRARDLVAADLVTVVIPDPDGNELVIQVADGDHAEALTGRGFPAEGSISGAVVLSGSSEVLEDISTDARPDQPVVELGNMGPPRSFRSPATVVRSAHSLRQPPWRAAVHQGVGSLPRGLRRTGGAGAGIRARPGGDPAPSSGAGPVS